MSRIMMVASEAAPFIKTGGLADVMGSLPAALERLREEVAVVLPRYRTAKMPHTERVWHQMHIHCGPHYFQVAIDRYEERGVVYLFVDCPPLFDRGGIYGEWGGSYHDNHLRYAVLSLAALGIARHGIFRPDIFHIHDWHTGLLPAYLRANYGGDPELKSCKIAYTIHNLGYQGNYSRDVMGELGLDGWLFHGDGLEFWNQVSFMKAAITWSDIVNAVSPTYAREIQTPEHGFSMDGVLRKNAFKVTGILNGIDYDEWNPATDPHLVSHFSSRTLSGKRLCKGHLLREMGLPEDAKRPLIGIVSRFASQKGFDIFGEAAAGLAQQDVSFAVLGSGDAWCEDMFRYFQATYPDKFAVRIGFDNGLSHRIEAGADMFLMPSKYEPCGLNQIYSLRYGTVPIVRATGGLADTVSEDTGFLFQSYSAGALSAAVLRALDAYQDKKAWTTRRRAGMAKDFSWDASARRYREMYHRLIG